MRAVLAYLIAPLAVALPVTAFFVLAWLFGVGPDASVALARLAALYMIASIVVSYILTLIVGVPAHLVLANAGRRSLTAYVLTGVLVVLVPLAGYFLWVVAFEGSGAVARNGPDFARAGALLCACAATVAAAFWAVAVRPESAGNEIG